MVAGLATDKGHANIAVGRTGMGKKSFVQRPGSVVVKRRLTVVMNAEIEGERYKKIFSKLHVR